MAAVAPPASVALEEAIPPMDEVEANLAKKATRLARIAMGFLGVALLINLASGNLGSVLVCGGLMAVTLYWGLRGIKNRDTSKIMWHGRLHVCYGCCILAVAPLVIAGISALHCACSEECRDKYLPDPMDFPLALNNSGVDSAPSASGFRPNSVVDTAHIPAPAGTPQCPKGEACSSEDATGVPRKLFRTHRRMRRRMKAAGRKHRGLKKHHRHGTRSWFARKFLDFFRPKPADGRLDDAEVRGTMPPRPPHTPPHQPPRPRPAPEAVGRAEDSADVRIMPFPAVEEQRHAAPMGRLRALQAVEEPDAGSEETATAIEEPAAGSEEPATGSEESATGSEEPATGSDASGHEEEAGERKHHFWNRNDERHGHHERHGVKQGNRGHQEGGRLRTSVPDWMRDDDNDDHEEGEWPTTREEATEMRNKIEEHLDEVCGNEVAMNAASGGGTVLVIILIAVGALHCKTGRAALRLAKHMRGEETPGMAPRRTFAQAGTPGAGLTRAQLVDGQAASGPAHYPLAGPTMVAAPAQGAATVPWTASLAARIGAAVARGRGYASVQTQDDAAPRAGPVGTGGALMLPESGDPTPSSAAASAAAAQSSDRVMSYEEYLRFVAAQQGGAALSKH